MKSNIDLTENRLFSRDNFFEDLALGALTIGGLTGTRIPWNAEFKQIKSDDEFDLDHQKKSIIATGNKLKRSEIREYRHMDSLDYCDCCGARMNKKPWDREIGVCHKCNDYYENKDKDRCLWRKKENMSNAVIRTA